MKKEILFKTLVDILFFLHLPGIVAIIFLLPMGAVTKHFNPLESNAVDLNLALGVTTLVTLSAYILFLRGLYFLRKMARFLLSNKSFSTKIIHNLKQSGNQFLYAGVIGLLAIFLTFVTSLYGGQFSVELSIESISPIFLIVIGLFFILQSNSLAMAKDLKAENDLTI